MPKLYEIVAIRKGVKQRAYTALTQVHRDSEREGAYKGLRRVYTKAFEDGMDLPPENQKVSLKATDIIDQTRDILTEQWDIEASQEYGNQSARADVVLPNGDVLLSDVPVTFLLHMEKQMSDLRTKVSVLPTLPTDADWKWAENQGYWQSEPVKSARTSTYDDHQVIVPPTDHHPAQVAAVKKSRLEGHWETTHLNGSLSVPQKRELLDRIDEVRDAIKQARTRANDTAVEKQYVAATLLNHIFDRFDRR